MCLLLVPGARARGHPWCGARRASCEAFKPGPPAGARGPGAEDHARLTLARAAGEADTAALLLERAAACADQPPMTALDAARCRRDYWLAASLLTTAVSRLFTAAGTGGVAERVCGR